MKTVRHILLGILLVVSAVSYSQTFTQLNTSSEQDAFLSSNFTSQVNAARSSNTVSNLVAVQQIGDFNTSVVNTISRESDIAILQRGNNNNSFLQIRANTIQQSVVQTGNDHSFIDFSPQFSELHQAEINQSGNGQNLTWFGSNSVSEKLKVSMSGSGQSVTIRNFN